MNAPRRVTRTRACLVDAIPRFQPVLVVGLLCFTQGAPARSKSPRPERTIRGRVLLRLKRCPSASALSADGRWLAIRRRKPRQIEVLSLPPTNAASGPVSQPARQPARVFTLAKHRQESSHTLALRLRFATAAKELLLLSFRYDTSDYSVMEGRGDRDDRLRVWRVRDGKLLLDEKAPTRGAKRSGSQQLLSWQVVKKGAGALLIATFDEAVRIYTLTSKRLRKHCTIASSTSELERGSSPIASVASQEGRYLAIAEGGSVEVYETARCRHLASLTLPQCRRRRGRRCNGEHYLVFTTPGLLVSDGVGGIYTPPTFKRARSFDDRARVDGTKLPPAYQLVRPHLLRLRMRRGLFVDRDLRDGRIRRWRGPRSLPTQGWWTDDGRLWVSPLPAGPRPTKRHYLVWAPKTQRRFRLVGPAAMQAPVIVARHKRWIELRALAGAAVLHFRLPR